MGTTVVLGQWISTGQVSDMAAELLLPLAWCVSLTVPRLRHALNITSVSPVSPTATPREHQATLDPPGLFLSSSCWAMLGVLVSVGTSHQNLGKAVWEHTVGILSRSWSLASSSPQWSFDTGFLVIEECPFIMGCFLLLLFVSSLIANLKITVEN